MSIDGLMAETSWLRRLALGLVRDRDVADDVVQETVIIAAEQAPRDRPLRPWLHRVLLNRVRMHGRGTARRSARELASGEVDAAASAATPEELVARVETQRLLAGLVLELGEPYRAVVLLRFVEGLTSPQIAARLGVADATVRWRLKQALEELRARLDERHGQRRALWLAPVGELARRAGDPETQTAAQAAAGAFLVKKLMIASAVALVLLVGGAAVWKLRGAGAPDQAGATAAADPWAGGGGSSAAAAAIVAAKRAARGGAAMELAPGRASGRITRAADGRGLAGAVVALAPRDLGLLGGDAGAVDLVVVADATGAWSAPAVPPGAYVVTATAPGLVPGTREDVVLAAGAARSGIDLALAAGGVTVRGTVSDISGGPIADARVRVSPDSIAQLKGPGGSFVAITGDDGQYRLTLPPGPWRAVAGSADYAPESQRFELAGAPLQVDFALTPGGVIHGRVVARGSGAPIEGATVTAKLGGAAVAAWAGATAVADATGTFTLRGLRSGAVELSATARGAASAEPTVVELGIGEQASDVLVELDRAHTISGFVVRKADQQTGVAGVNVGMFSLAGLESESASRPSAADGYFEIHGVAPGAYTMFALGRDIMPSFGQVVTVKDADVDDVLLGVETGATLSGRVEPAAIGALGLEVDPSTIGLTNMFDAVGAALVTGSSDASGAFALRNVPAGSFTLVARTADGRVGRLAIEASGRDQGGLVVKLEPRAAIAGRVVDAAGAPVAGVRVRATTRTGSPGLRSSGADGAVTGADGGFRIGGLAAGRFHVTVVDEAGPLAWADAAHRTDPDRPIAVELAERQERTGLTLTVEARDGVIRGVVLGADRQPAPDTWVSARLSSPRGPRPPGQGSVVVVASSSPSPPPPAPGGGEAPSAEARTEVSTEDAEAALGGAHTVLTDEGGRFTIPRLRRGAYELVAEGKRGAAAARREAVKPGESVTLVLEPLGSLAGVVTAGGAPVADYRIECRGPAKSVRRRVVTADGAYAFERLPAGAYTCAVSSPHGPARGAVHVSGATRLELAVGSWGSLTGTIVDARTGAPLPNLKLAVVGEGGEPSDVEGLLGSGPATDAAGRFELGKQPARTAQLLALSVAPLQVVSLTSFTLAAGQRLDLGAIQALPPRLGPPGTLGMEVEVEGDRLVVAAVSPGGPAAKAGIVAGDAIAALDGRLVGALTPPLAARMLDADHVAAGQAIAIRLARGVELAVTGAPVAGAPAAP